MKERVLFIDVAKGIAIIAIVMLHFSYQFDGESARLITLFNHSWDTRLFFVLSGMVASMGGVKLENVRELLLFVKKKSLTLLLPFVVWSTIITPYVINRATIKDYPTIFIDEFVPPLGGYWFLLYLFVIQVMFGVAKYVSEQLERYVSNKLYRELLISAILSAPLFLIYEYVLYFLFGYIIFVYGKGILFNKNVQFLSFCLFVILFELKRENVEFSFILQLLIALTASVFIIGITYNIQMTGAIQGIIGRFLCFFGSNSLEIYLLHYVFISACAGIHISVSHVHAIPLYVMVLGVSICICFLCCGVGNVLKRIPYISMLLLGNRH